MQPQTALELGRFLLLLVPVWVLLVAWRRRARVARVRPLLVRCRLLRAPLPGPNRPPLQQLAADLRRLYPDAHFPRKGLGMPKQRGILMAYDTRLCDTAAALEIPTDLLELPFNAFEREVERLRVEHALADAGLVWRVWRDPYRADPAA